MHDVADALQRDVVTEYSGSPKLVFGVSFLLWVRSFSSSSPGRSRDEELTRSSTRSQLLWMVVSFSIYFMAAGQNLLAAGEFSWSFGSTFSALSESPSRVLAATPSRVRV